MFLAHFGDITTNYIACISFLGRR